MQTTQCNLCGSVEAKPFHQNPDYLLKKFEVEFCYVQCVRCGLVYQNPRPDPHEIGDYYPPEYESYSDVSRYETPSLLSRISRDYGIKKRANFILRYKAGGNILDIGCATGQHLNYYQFLPGWKPFGVEVNPGAAEIARQRFGLDVRTGTLDEAGFPDAFFDAVTLWDVLEHLHDPGTSLKEIHRILKPGGILAIRVPNGNSLDAKLFGQYWAGLDAPRHLYVFTPTTINQYLERNNFQVITQTTQSGAYTTFLLSYRFYLSTRGDSRWQKVLLSALYSPIVKIIASPIFYLRSLFLQGPQLVVVSRRGAAR